jgi:hypothetical protein
MVICGDVTRSLCYGRMAVAALGKPAVGQVFRREEWQSAVYFCVPTPCRFCATSLLHSATWCCSIILWTVLDVFSYTRVKAPEPVTVGTPSKSWTVFACSNTGIVGSNPTRAMYICVRLVCVCAVLCVGSGLATGWCPIQGVLQTID